MSLPDGAEAISRIMGLEPQQAYDTLVAMYGADVADEVIGIGRIWQRPGLTRRERSFVAIAALATIGTNANPGHCRSTRVRCDNGRGDAFAEPFVFATVAGPREDDVRRPL